MSSNIKHVLELDESYLKESMIKMAVLSTLLGLLSVCTAVAVYVLFSKGIKRSAIAGMLIAVVAMWVSTVAYWVTMILSAAKSYTALRDLTENAQDSLTDQPASKAYGIANCTAIVALTVNVVIGDSIVLWRAWVLWPDNRVVNCLCFFMILLTLMSGLEVITAGPCVDGADYLSDLGSTVLSSRDLRGLVAGLCSLLTNLVATTLIGYRAWKHRHIIMSYLKGSSPRTQVERTLALLVESGLLYCALWVVVVVYQCSYLSPELESSAFADVFQYIMGGGLVPLIGLYPTLIVILCAVDKSLHEKSTNDYGRNISIVFQGEPPSRRRGTLSELLSAASAYDAGPEEHPGNPHDSEALRNESHDSALTAARRASV